MSKYSMEVSAGSARDEIQVEQLYTLESQMSDEQRFRDVTKWKVECILCSQTNDFVGPFYMVCLLCYLSHVF